MQTTTEIGVANTPATSDVRKTPSSSQTMSTSTSSPSIQEWETQLAGCDGDPPVWAARFNSAIQGKADQEIRHAQALLKIEVESRKALFEDAVGACEAVADALIDSVKLSTPVPDLVKLVEENERPLRWNPARAGDWLEAARLRWASLEFKYEHAKDLATRLDVLSYMNSLLGATKALAALVPRAADEFVPTIKRWGAKKEELREQYIQEEHTTVKSEEAKPSFWSRLREPSEETFWTKLRISEWFSPPVSASQKRQGRVSWIAHLIRSSFLEWWLSYDLWSFTTVQLILAVVLCVVAFTMWLNKDKWIIVKRVREGVSRKPYALNLGAENGHYVFKIAGWAKLMIKISLAVAILCTIGDLVVDMANAFANIGKVKRMFKWIKVKVTKGKDGKLAVESDVTKDGLASDPKTNALKDTAIRIMTDKAACLALIGAGALVMVLFYGLQKNRVKLARYFRDLLKTSTPEEKEEIEDILDKSVLEGRGKGSNANKARGKAQNRAARATGYTRAKGIKTAKAWIDYDENGDIIPPMKEDSPSSSRPTPSVVSPAEHAARKSKLMTPKPIVLPPKRRGEGVSVRVPTKEKPYPYAEKEYKALSEDERAAFKELLTKLGLSSAERKKALKASRAAAAAPTPDLTKYADTPCKFGLNCKRKNCWFKHVTPEIKKNEGFVNGSEPMLAASMVLPLFATKEDSENFAAKKADKKIGHCIFALNQIVTAAHLVIDGKNSFEVWTLTATNQPIALNSFEQLKVDGKFIDVARAPIPSALQGAVRSCDVVDNGRIRDAIKSQVPVNIQCFQGTQRVMLAGRLVDALPSAANAMAPYEFVHTCSSEVGVCGSPILKLGMLIGIHVAGGINKNAGHNYGSLVSKALLSGK